MENFFFLGEGVTLLPPQKIAELVIDGGSDKSGKKYLVSELPADLPNHGEFTVFSCSKNERRVFSPYPGGRIRVARMGKTRGPLFLEEVAPPRRTGVVREELSYTSSHIITHQKRSFESEDQRMVETVFSNTVVIKTYSQIFETWEQIDPFTGSILIVERPRGEPVLCDERTVPI